MYARPTPPFRRTNRDVPSSRVSSCRLGRARRPAQSATPARVPGARHGDGHGGARRRHRQRSAADGGARLRRHAREFGLDRQRLPARGHGFPAAARGAGRYSRLPPGLLAGPRPLHRRFARLRPRPEFCRADARPSGSGVRRCGNHERQYRARPVHLSRVAARAGRRQHGGGRRRLLGGKPERRGRHSVRRLLALALSHQCPGRRGGAADGPSIPARHAALRPRPRSHERDPQRADLRPSDHRA